MSLKQTLRNWLLENEEPVDRAASRDSDEDERYVALRHEIRDVEDHLRHLGRHQMAQGTPTVLRCPRCRCLITEQEAKTVTVEGSDERLHVCGKCDVPTL